LEETCDDSHTAPDDRRRNSFRKKKEVQEKEKSDTVGGASNVVATTPQKTRPLEQKEKVEKKTTRREGKDIDLKLKNRLPL